MGNKASDNEKQLEKERKEKLADELKKQALFEEKRLEKRKLQVLEELKRLGLTEEEYWNHIALEQSKKGKKQRDDDEYEYFRKLEESGKSKEEMLEAWMAYQTSRASQAARTEMEKEKNHSKFRNWGQWNYDKTEKFEKIAAKNGVAAAIFLYLARKSDKYNKVICSYKVLQEEFHISERTVGRAIQCLEENKLLTIYKTGSSNVYVLDNSITWKSDGWRNEYCEFDAKVIITRSEQRKERSEKMKEIMRLKKEEKEREEREAEEQKDE